MDVAPATRPGHGLHPRFQTHQPRPERRVRIPAARLSPWLPGNDLRGAHYGSKVGHEN